MKYNVLNIEELLSNFSADERKFIHRSFQYENINFFHLDNEFLNLRMTYDGYIYLNNYNMEEFSCSLDVNAITGEVFKCSFKGKVSKNISIASAIYRTKEKWQRIHKEATFIRTPDIDKVLNELTDESNITEFLNVDIILEHKGFNNVGEYIFNSKIGNKFKIQIKKQINSILNCIYNGSGKVVLSSRLTFDGSIHSITNTDQKILEFSKQILNAKEDYAIKQDALSSFIDYVLSLGKEITVIDDAFINHKITFKSAEINPDILLNIIDSEENICVNFDFIEPIDINYTYIVYKNIVYKLANKQSKLLKAVFSVNGAKLEINKNEIDKFNTILLPKLRKLTRTITIDEKIKDAIIIPKIKLKLLFDLFNEGVICEIHNEESNIKNILNKDYIIVDEELEKESISFLTNNGFILNEIKGRLELTNEEGIFKFMEDGIKNIPSYFDILITDSLKKVQYSASTNVKSDFSIGKDGILNCKFEIEGISSNEAESLMSAIKEKKKYHRLKNGDIIKLRNNEELNELGNISRFLNISNKNILNNNKLPSYKAIYLNNLKNNEKLSYINTNKKFENLINSFNQYKDKVIDFDSRDLEVLRDYQKIGVNFLTTVYNCGFGAILADEMGLGKTLQVITFIKYLLRKDNKKNFLVVCPTSLIYNWQNEFSKFAPDIKVLALGDNKYIRKQYFEKLDEYEVFITSYGMMRQDFDNHVGIKYDTIIIDEAQAIKNINSDTSKAINELNAKCKIALTGTPMENSMMELYSIFNFIMPGFLGAKTTFNTRFTKEIIDGNKEILKQFNLLTQPFILRRKKKNVLKDLPNKIETNLIYEMGEEQKKIYQIYLKESQKEVEQLIEEGNVLKSNFKLLTILTRLKQICIDPKLCVKDYTGPSVKMEAILEMLNNIIEEKHKVLIFSQYVKTFDLLKPLLKQNSINYYYIDGQVKSKDRFNLVEKFNSDDTPLFLISLNAGGNGLNLTGADIVIHLDMWWNPAKEDQATDRAHRIGQSNVVEVIKPIIKDTIEEEILALQIKKRDLCSKIIDCEEAEKLVVSSLTIDEIKQLLSMS